MLQVERNKQAALDTLAACATTGVTSTTPTVAWTPNDTTAGYNTTYKASITLTADDAYEFATGVIATVNGQSATSVIKNQNGTLTVTYEFPATAKAKLTSITAPTGNTVANGTAYANMGLPTNVAIVTEGNTVTTAAVEWDTTTPASGSYDQAVLTQQSVTLNGTVTCPSNIDPNGVMLTTTITVTISSAGIVGTPTFALVEGTYTENQSVELISSTDGATIYYTTNGTPPTTDSDVYSEAIPITGIVGQSKSTTINAIAVKSGMQTSNVASATYVIEIPALAPTYTITAGVGETHELGTDGTITITCDGALDELAGIYVDDKLVDAADYTLKSGSTILTFKAAYLNTLSVGTYKVKFQYSDGSTETAFVIKEESPETGDSTPIAWLFIIAVISGAGVVYFGRKKKTVR